VADLLLDDRKCDFSAYCIVHNVAVTQRMDSEHLQLPALAVLPVCLLQASLLYVTLEQLPNSILSIPMALPLTRME